jgi:hypothetical protein
VISRVSVELKTEVPQIFISESTLMMQTEELSETLVFKSALTRLIAQEDFSTLILRESFKSYGLPH